MIPGLERSQHSAAGELKLRFKDAEEGAWLLRSAALSKVFSSDNATFGSRRCAGIGASLPLTSITWVVEVSVGEQLQYTGTNVLNYPRNQYRDYSES
jgi:hypothetical protein